MSCASFFAATCASGKFGGVGAGWVGFQDVVIWYWNREKQGPPGKSVLHCCRYSCRCHSTAGSSSASTGWSNAMSPLSSQASEQMPLNVSHSLFVALVWYSLHTGPAHHCMLQREFKPDAYGGGWVESDENSVEMTGVPKPEQHRMGSGEYIDWVAIQFSKNMAPPNRK